MDPLVGGIAILISVLINFWQFNVNGELKAENDHLSGIVKQCSVDREQERRATSDAADVRAREEIALGRELTRQEQHVRDIVENADDSCLDSSSPLGSKLVDREQQATDSINGVWLRSTTSSND